MNFLYTDVPMSHVLSLNPYSNPKVPSPTKDANNNQLGMEVMNYLQPQKYEEPELSRATGGLHQSEWTAEFVFSKSSMASETEVGIEVGTEACPEEKGSCLDEPIMVTVVREPLRRKSHNGQSILRDQYLSRRQTISGGKICTYASDMHEKKREGS